jgi:hypothetical protein
MSDTHIGFAHFRIVRHRLVIAFGQHAAARQHGDGVGQIGHHRQIMFDHQHGAVGGDAADQLRDAVDVLMAHAGGRLVEQQHFRIERQGGGDIQRALAAIGQFDRIPGGEFGQADIGDQRHRLAVVFVEHGTRAPEVHRVAAEPLQGDAHVLQHGHVREHGGNLERAHQSEAGHVGRRHRGDVLALEDDAAAGRAQELGQQVEAGGLAGAVRPNQRMDAAPRDTQVNAADRGKSGKFLGKTLGFEDDLGTHYAAFPSERNSPQIQSAGKRL